MDGRAVAADVAGTESPIAGEFLAEAGREAPESVTPEMVWRFEEWGRAAGTG